jgi:hypothetical protein
MVPEYENSPILTAYEASKYGCLAYFNEQSGVSIRCSQTLDKPPGLGNLTSRPHVV